MDAAPDVNARRLLGGFNGVFYVDDASSARDAQDRLIIAARDFVAEHGVKTVFGMGGAYPDGTLLVIIVFAREHLTRKSGGAAHVAHQRLQGRDVRGRARPLLRVARAANNLGGHSTPGSLRRNPRRAPSSVYLCLSQRVGIAQ